MDRPDSPETYAARAHRHQWGLRVVLLQVAAAAKRGDKRDMRFWFRVAEITTKTVHDPDEDYWTEEDI